MPVRRSKGRGQSKRGDGARDRKLSLDVRAQVVAEADTSPGQDATVAARYGISLRSLQRYRLQASTDEGLARLVAHKKSLIEDDWRAEAVKTIRRGMRTINKLFALAEQEADRISAQGGDFPKGRLHEVTGAWHLVAGELTTKDALSADGDGADREGPSAEEDGGEAPSGAEEQADSPPTH